MIFINISYLIFSSLRSCFIIIFLVMSVAFLTLIERKILGGMQRRCGPNIVGFYGILQPFCDGLKLLAKETVLPGLSNWIIFILSPIILFILSFLSWIILPFFAGIVVADIEAGIFFFFFLSSLSVYGLIMGGWSSNSRYAFIGALRSSAQMISYEVSMGLIIMVIIICCESLNFSNFVFFQREVFLFGPFLPSVILLFISILAETNRSPFDLPEAEAELVSGFNVEYSAVGFVFFFIAEYLHIMCMSFFFIILFLGGWYPFFDFVGLFFFSAIFWICIKYLFVLYCFIWVRAVLPRYRYDQLMFLGWKIFLPCSLFWFFFIICLFIFVS